MITIIKDGDKACLQYNEATNALELVWKKMNDNESFRSYYQLVVNELIDRKATGWLTDNRRQGVVSPTNIQWLREEIMPFLLKNGLKRVAIILNEDVFRKYYLDNFGKKIDDGEEELTQYFDSVEKANEWLGELTNSIV